MFYVYILRSTKNNSLYIGFAVDLKKRIVKHNQGLVQSTKHLRPFELMYYEAYKSKKDALIREKRLKQFAQGLTAIKGRLKNSLMLSG